MLPARLDSARLPGKVLADLDGRSMLEHVWLRACAAGCFDRIVVATDSKAVAAVAEAFGAEVARTGPAPSGTARVAEVVGDTPVSVVNVQADQPLLDPLHLVALVAGLAPGQVATLAAVGEGDPTDPARVKVETDEHGFASRFTRRWAGGDRPWRLHVGLYGFAPGTISRCVGAPRSASMAEEDLEQLAWLEAGIPIRVFPVDHVARSVDTLADLATVRRLISRPPEAP